MKNIQKQIKHRKMPLKRERKKKSRFFVTIPLTKVKFLKRFSPRMLIVHLQGAPPMLPHSWNNASRSLGLSEVGSDGCIKPSLLAQTPGERVMGTAQQCAAISLRQQTVAPSVALFKRHLYFRFKERSFPLWQEILDSRTRPNRKKQEGGKRRGKKLPHQNSNKVDDCQWRLM